MAEKSKTLHVLIVETATHKTVVRKTFFKASDASVWIKEMTEPKKQKKDDPTVPEPPKYPKPTYYVHKEML